jgi:hypothetical protein
VNDLIEVGQLLLLLVGVVGIPMGLYLGFRVALSRVKAMEAEARARIGPDGRQVAELEQRMAELEERLDFTERVLAAGQSTVDSRRSTVDR